MIRNASTSRNTFNNPFEEINANVIDVKKIVEYWCDPFKLGIMTNYDQRKFLTSKIPIIIQGSRGSGKTTILKYFSFPAQVERTSIFKEKSVLDTVKKEGGVGFYYRCEESFLSTFTAIFKNVKPDDWTKIFECYIELVFSEKILEMITILYNRGEISELTEKEIHNILTRVGISFDSTISSIQQLYDFVHAEVLYFEQYKNRVIFSNEDFHPNILVDIFSLSRSIVSELKAKEPTLNSILFILMIDEYENLTEDLQKRINTIIKFAKDDISIRIGRRREGRFTTETVNEVEYLRENHDYYLASLDGEPNNKIMKPYFMEVANRRFSQAETSFPEEKDISIVNVLGDREDLVWECKKVCGNRKQHIDVVLRQSRELAKDSSLREKIIKIIGNDSNPIAETINALWVIRDQKKDYIQTAEYAATAMDAYFRNRTAKGVEKYKSDYSDKYRYAITVFICSVYKKDKLYYGFNALSLLSNGNVRTFINFCQSILNDALFYEKNNFLKTGKISEEVQSNAIRSFSKSEFNDICSVVFAGDKIRRVVLNLGTSFSAFHKDPKLRYPETTQFALDLTKLNEADKEILRTAESWSIIIKRQKVQRTSAGVNERTELYYVNKMFSPIFNISYRTRGGVNMLLNATDFHEMLNSDSFSPSSVQRLFNGQSIIFGKDNGEPEQQLSLFEMRSKDE